MEKSILKNVFAWCIVPYDKLKRTPEQRIEMLKELGINGYAYDWRQEHLSEMKYELELAQRNSIEIIAVWIWIDTERDQPGKLCRENEKVFEILNELKLSTQVWVGIHPNYFDGLEEEKKIVKGKKIIGYLCERASESGSKIALYNHGDWFGEPESQIKIIKQLPEWEIGIIYNFHHGHTHLDRFNEVFGIVKPYLWAINVNGMRAEGPKIIPVGKGEKEKDMINSILESGYTGPFGIIGHVEDADVKEILLQNLNGLKEILNVN